MALNAIDEWLERGPIDFMLVIGTSLCVWPAADYVNLARAKGARLAIFNRDREDEPVDGIWDSDWFFEGDVAATVPELLKVEISLVTC